MDDNIKFINHINNHYNQLKNKYKRFCQEKDLQWDEDIYSDTILKCYDAITRKGGLDDTSPQGIENYFFKSFRINLARDKTYSRNIKRDRNIQDDDINNLYECYCEQHQLSHRQKLLSDLYKDYATLYIMAIVESNFPPDDFYLFRLKYLSGMTYKAIQDKTQQSKVRQRIVAIKQYIRENVTKDDIWSSFYSRYSELI